MKPKANRNRAHWIGHSLKAFGVGCGDGERQRSVRKCWWRQVLGPVFTNSGGWDGMGGGSVFRLQPCTQNKRRSSMTETPHRQRKTFCCCCRPTYRSPCSRTALLLINIVVPVLSTPSQSCCHFRVCCPCPPR